MRSDATTSWEEQEANGELEAGGEGWASRGSGAMRMVQQEPMTLPTSQGKQEGGAKASVTQWWVNKGKVWARPLQQRLEVAEQWGKTSKKNNSCVFHLVQHRISTVSSC